MVLLEAKGLGKTYRKGAFTLHPIDLELKSGEMTGLVGENGNGKTTLLKILAGLLERDRGELFYHMDVENTWTAIKPEIGYISQSIKKWMGTVYENLHYHAALRKIRGKENEIYVNKIIQDLGLWEYRHLAWSELSGGYQMRFELAKTLVQKPKLLILDEPLANLDIKAQTTFLSDLRKFQANVDFPISIIVSSQHLYKIEEVSDNIIFLKQGKCVYNGTSNQVGNEAQHHAFEVVVSQHELMETWLGSLIETRHVREGNTYIIYTQKEMSARQFLEQMLAQEITPLSYRDISNSTRQLFESI